MTYRNHKTLQKRGGAGRFERWDLDRDFGARVCPWCNSFALRPPQPMSGFIDPDEFNRRVCACGWDSAGGRVSRATLKAAVIRYSDALASASAAHGCGDTEAEAILNHQLRREERRATELLWLDEERTWRK